MVEALLTKYYLADGILQPAEAPYKKAWLIGINKVAGWQYLPDSVIYSFNIGDEFHYKNSSVNSMIQPSVSDSEEKIEKTVIAKKVVNDSVTYTYKRTYEWKPLIFESSKPYTFKRDTIKESHFLSGTVREV